MQAWQICHLALVVPLADAYYKAENPEEVWKEADIMNDTARYIKNNFQKLYRSGVKLSPPKMHLLRLLPAPVLQGIFTQVFKSRFGNLFMYRHSMKAPDEMKELHNQFYGYLTETAASLQPSAPNATIIEGKLLNGRQDKASLAEWTARF